MPLWKNTFEKLKKFKVYVDTDDNDLIEELLKYDNVIAYPREESLVGHKVSVCDLIKFWVSKYDPPGFLFQVHVTSPFLKADTLLKAFNKMSNKNDSVFSCTEHQTRFWYKNKSINHDPNILIQTQDLEPLFEENSLFYGFKKNIALSGLRIGKNPLLYTTSTEESMDIDTEDDWEKCIEHHKRININAKF